MRNPYNSPPPSDAPPVEEEVQAQIEDYLDYLCAPLLGIVPYPQRRRLRLERVRHFPSAVT